MHLADTMLHRDFILFYFILFCILCCLEATNNVKNIFLGTIQQIAGTTRQLKILEFKIIQFK